MLYLFKNSHMLFRIYSRFSDSLSVNRCRVNHVHVGGLWCPNSPWVFIQSSSNLVTMILRYWGFLLWLFFKNPQLFFWIYSRSLCMDRCRFNDVHVGWYLIHCMSRLKCEQSVQAGPVIPANTKRRSNVVLMLSQRRRQWYDIQPTERQINMFTGPSECVSISQTNIYLYKSTKAQWGLLISEIESLKSEYWSL